MRRSGLALLLLPFFACGWNEAEPYEPAGPDFGTSVLVEDPSTVVVVDGVNVPKNVKVRGTVAGVEVLVDHASVDLSNATVECVNRIDGPKIGVSIPGNLVGVKVDGGGTALIRGCAIGVLVGEIDPTLGNPGGMKHTVRGLRIESGIGTVECPFVSCGTGISISNSHDNVVSRNQLLRPGEPGILVTGFDPASSSSGRNTVRDNSVDGFADFGIWISTDGNSVQRNVVRGWFYNIIVDHDRNEISDNVVGFFEGSCGCAGVKLLSGADDNTVRGNVLPPDSPGVGINPDYASFMAEVETFRNVFTKNIALAPVDMSARDLSGGCDNNMWYRNDFAMRDPACIR